MKVNMKNYSTKKYRQQNEFRKINNGSCKNIMFDLQMILYFIAF